MNTITRFFREVEKTRSLDIVTFLVKLLSPEYPWLGSFLSQGKAIVLSHKHKHVHNVHVCTLLCAHAQPGTVFNAIYGTVPPLWLDLITLARVWGFPHTRDLTRADAAALSTRHATHDDRRAV